MRHLIVALIGLVLGVVACANPTPTAQPTLSAMPTPTQIPSPTNTPDESTISAPEVVSRLKAFLQAKALEAGDEANEQLQMFSDEELTSYPGLQAQVDYFVSASEAAGTRGFRSSLEPHYFEKGTWLVILEPTDGSQYVGRELWWFFERSGSEPILADGPIPAELMSALALSAQAPNTAAARRAAAVLQATVTP